MNGGRQLREMVATSVRLVHLCALPAVLVLLPDLVVMRGDVSASSLTVALLIVSCALMIRVWHLLHRDSMNAFFMLNGGGAALFMSGLVVALWQARRFGNVQWLFDDYMHLYVSGAIVVCVGVATWIITRATHLRECYGTFQAYLETGEIPDYVLWSLMSPGGRLDGAKGKIGAAVGASLGGTMLAGALGGRSALGYLYFVLSLVVTCYLLGVLGARLWAHWKFMGWRDLRIRWSNGVGRS